MQYNDMSKEELLALKESLNKEYAEAKAKGLALDMSRGFRWNRLQKLWCFRWYSRSKEAYGRYDGNNTRSCYCVWKRKS